MRLVWSQLCQLTRTQEAAPNSSGCPCEEDGILGSLLCSPALLVPGIWGCESVDEDSLIPFLCLSNKMKINKTKIPKSARMGRGRRLSHNSAPVLDLSKIPNPHYRSFPKAVTQRLKKKLRVPEVSKLSSL